MLWVPGCRKEGRELACQRVRLCPLRECRKLNSGARLPPRQQLHRPARSLPHNCRVSQLKEEGLVLHRPGAVRPQKAHTSKRAVHVLGGPLPQRSLVGRRHSRVRRVAHAREREPGPQGLACEQKSACKSDQERCSDEAAVYEHRSEPRRRRLHGWHACAPAGRMRRAHLRRQAFAASASRVQLRAHCTLANILRVCGRVVKGKLGLGGLHAPQQRPGHGGEPGGAAAAPSGDTCRGRCGRTTASGFVTGDPADGLASSRAGLCAPAPAAGDADPGTTSVVSGDDALVNCPLMPRLRRLMDRSRQRQFAAAACSSGPRPNASFSDVHSITTSTTHPPRIVTPSKARPT
mmetsp:Transcript_5620/g.23834  ORF Transcript_5620/g.23834 Transcript_5620/m.23834 type:complete len:348 (+) Transcript_5620:1145-2188(+)